MLRRQNQENKYCSACAKSALRQRPPQSCVRRGASLSHLMTSMSNGYGTPRVSQNFARWVERCVGKVAKERSDLEMQEGQKLNPLRYSCTCEVERVLLCGVTGPRASHAHLSANLVQRLFHLKRLKYRTATATFMLRPWCCRTLPTWLSRATTSVEHRLASCWWPPLGNVEEETDLPSPRGTLPNFAHRCQRRPRCEEGRLYWSGVDLEDLPRRTCYMLVWPQSRSKTICFPRLAPLVRAHSPRMTHHVSSRVET